MVVWATTRNRAFQFVCSCSSKSNQGLCLLRAHICWHCHEIHSSQDNQIRVQDRVREREISCLNCLTESHREKTGDGFGVQNNVENPIEMICDNQPVRMETIGRFVRSKSPRNEGRFERGRRCPIFCWGSTQAQTSEKRP